jgi:hypothetical protein
MNQQSRRDDDDDATATRVIWQHGIPKLRKPSESTITGGLTAISLPAPPRLTKYQDRKVSTAGESGAETGWRGF